MRRERDKKQQERLADAADVTAERETRAETAASGAAVARQALASADTDSHTNAGGSSSAVGPAAESAGTHTHANAGGSTVGPGAESADTDTQANARGSGSGSTVGPGAEQAAGPRRAAGALESAVLGVLWSASEPLSPGEVREKLARSESADGGPTLSYSTVVTILTRLHEKRALSRQRDGRAYRYAPLADEAGLAARRLSQLLDRAPDREAVLSRFVADLSERDEQVLRDLLGGRGDGAGSSGTA